MVRYSEEVVDGVLRQLADEGNVVIVWQAEDILQELEYFQEDSGIDVTEDQKQEIVKRVQGSREWASLVDVDDWQYELIHYAIEDALEVLGIGDE